MDLNDTYAEHLVKRNPTAVTYLLRLTAGLLCLAAVWIVITGRLVGLVIGALALGAAYLIVINTSVEYEYLYVDGQLTVDKILSRSRRKQVFLCNLDQVEIIAPSSSFVLKDYEKPQMRRLDFSSGDRSKQSYVLICQEGAQTSKVIIEPDEKLLSCFKRKVPRKASF